MPRKIIMDDGFNPEFVETALFDGKLEIPRYDKPEKIIIPKRLIPFSKRHYSKNKSEEFVVFYENDNNFSDILIDPIPYIKELSEFAGVVAPDCSLYIDSPLTVQIANVYRSHAIGNLFSTSGLYTVPNTRWGDERSYTTSVLPEKFAFLGLPKHSILSLGTYGVCKTREEKYHLRHGLIAMLDDLAPEVVLIYGAMPKDVFYGLYDRTRFIQYPDWITYVKGGAAYGNR